MKKILLILLLFLWGVPQALAQSSETTVRTRVGNPPDTTACWPSSGPITQGPKGVTSHAALSRDFSGESIDIGSSMGAPVYATFDGKAEVFNCTATGRCDGGYGNLVKITPKSNPNTKVYYAHLFQILVTEGQSISKGDKIGMVGATGNAKGAHLHYEFRGGGMQMETPNIPANIVPPNCDGSCTPAFVNADPSSCVSKSSPIVSNETYWFLLHRQSNTEELLKGTPGDKDKSTLVKEFKVKTGIPGERPTPLPSLVGREYWIITEKHPESAPETAPYFMTLDIPAPQQFPFGPSPYTECNGEQCNWVVAGFFGLHGVGGDNSRLSASNRGSSGCIRHSNEDITYLYNLLDPANNEIRYYVEDN